MSETRVFPLSLAPIDAFFQADDTPAFPMTSFIYFDFVGHLERESFQEALGQALKRHPLLSAVIRPAKRNVPCWVASDQPPFVDWQVAGVPIECRQGEFIDLRSECGLRIWVRVGGGRSRIMLQLHHACTDGTGVYRFMGDLLAIYGIRTGDKSALPRLIDLDPSLIRNRRRKMADVALHGTTWQCLSKVLQQAYDVFGKSVMPVAAPVEPIGPGLTAPFGGISTVEFDADEHQALRTAAAEHGAMMNDLMIAEILLAVERWNGRNGDVRGNPRMRLMMPFDMRDQRDYAMPAANMTAYTFLTRRRRDCHDPVQLLSGIRDETARIKQGKHGTDFIDSLMIAEKASGALPILLRRNRCIATVTLSNVGDPSKRFLASFPRDAGRAVCGNVILDGVTGVPPLRNMMRASLAVFSYRRKLTICMRCDPELFSTAATQDLLNEYAMGLRSHLSKLPKRKIA